MKTIYKYKVTDLERVRTGFPIELGLPKHAHVFAAGLINRTIYIWAVVDAHAETEKRTFVVYETGSAITGNLENQKHLGTVIWEESYVAHVFEFELLKLNSK